MRVNNISLGSHNYKNYGNAAQGKIVNTNPISKNQSFDSVSFTGKELNLFDYAQLGLLKGLSEGDVSTGGAMYVRGLEIPKKIDLEQVKKEEKALRTVRQIVTASERKRIAIVNSDNLSLTPTDVIDGDEYLWYYTVRDKTGPIIGIKKNGEDIGSYVIFDNALIYSEIDIDGESYLTLGNVFYLEEMRFYTNCRNWTAPRKKTDDLMYMDFCPKNSFSFSVVDDSLIKKEGNVSVTLCLSKTKVGEEAKRQYRFKDGQLVEAANNVLQIDPTKLISYRNPKREEVFYYKDGKLVEARRGEVNWPCPGYAKKVWTYNPDGTINSIKTNYLSGDADWVCVRDKGIFYVGVSNGIIVKKAFVPNEKNDGYVVLRDEKIKVDNDDETLFNKYAFRQDN